MIAPSLPKAHKVLVLAPHPDDEAIGCGGTIALYSSIGAEVYLALISSGENIVVEFEGDIDIAETRRRESEASAQILGIKKIHLLGFPDGQLTLHKDGIEEKLRKIIHEINPDIIFAPSPFDYHDDHRSVSEVAIRFLTEGCVFKTAFYEVYGTIRFNTLVDISSVLTIKENAIRSYYYSLYKKPDIYCEAIKGFNRFRTFYTGQSGYYEAFWIISSPFSHSEICSWHTYGIDTESKFLSITKTVDKLIFELNKSHSLLDDKEAEIRQMEKDFFEIKQQLADLNLQLKEMQSSFIWRLAKKYYHFRDTLLPEGSSLRNIYNRLVLLVKGR